MCEGANGGRDVHWVPGPPVVRMLLGSLLPGARDALSRNQAGAREF